MLSVNERKGMDKKNTESGLTCIQSEYESKVRLESKNLNYVEASAEQNSK